MKYEEKCLKENTFFKGRVLSFHNDEVICSNGVKSTREYVKHPGGVTILAVKEDKVLFVKQFRYPYQEELLELPAGKLEKGEDPLIAAHRELEEETGYKSDNIVSMGYIYPTVGYSNEILHLYYATDLVKTHTHFDEDEEMDLYEYSIDEVNEMIISGQIVDAKTICAFYKFKEVIKG